jgi:hypothetical protein
MRMGMAIQKQNAKWKSKSENGLSSTVWYLYLGT